MQIFSHVRNEPIVDLLIDKLTVINKAKPYRLFVIETKLARQIIKKIFLNNNQQT